MLAALAPLIGAPACTTGPTSEILEGLAFVSTVDVTVSETGPLVVEVLATGNLSDPCTALESIEQERSDREFTIRMTTVRDRDALCAQVLVPFEERFLLEQAGLPPDDYTVTVNGVSASFTVAR